MNLELVREKGKIAVYELGFNLDDERELLLEVECGKRGKINNIDMVEIVIANIYDIMNAIKMEFASIKGKNIRALDYVVNNSMSMSEVKKEKYFSKIIETKWEMNYLENHRRNYKNLLKFLYKLFPSEYSKQMTIERLKKEKQSLEEQIQTLSQNPNSICC